MIASSALPGCSVSSMCQTTAKVGELHLDSPHVSEAFLGTLTKQGGNTNSSPRAVTVFLNGKPTQFEIDMGAEVSVISQKAHREIGSPKLYHPQRILRGPSNYALPVKGQFMGKLRKGDREVEQELYVVENLRKQLLGRPAVEVLELAVCIEAVEGERRSPIDQFPKLFQGLGKLESTRSNSKREQNPLL